MIIPLLSRPGPGAVWRQNSQRRDDGDGFVRVMGLAHHPRPGSWPEAAAGTQETTARSEQKI
jgi:hypothetical protein